MYECRIVCVGLKFVIAAISSVAVLLCNIILCFVFHGIVAVVFGAVDGVVVVVGACTAIVVIVISIISVVPVGWIVPDVTMGGLIISIVIILMMVSSFLVLDFYCSRTAKISEQSRIEREARKRKSFDHD